MLLLGPQLREAQKKKFSEVLNFSRNLSLLNYYIPGGPKISRNFFL